MQDTRKETDLPPQGERTPRGRRGGGIVPATPVSSSDAGLPTGLTASPVGEIAIAGKVLRVSLERLPSVLGSSRPEDKGTGFCQKQKGPFVFGDPGCGKQQQGGVFVFGGPSTTAGKSPMEEMDVSVGPSPAISVELLPGTSTSQESLHNTRRRGKGASHVLKKAGRCPPTPKMVVKGQGRAPFTEDSGGVSRVSRSSGRRVETPGEIFKDREFLRARCTQLERWGLDLTMDLKALEVSGVCRLCRGSKRPVGGKGGALLSPASAGGEPAPDSGRGGREAGCQTEEFPPVLAPPPVGLGMGGFDPDLFYERVGTLIAEKVAALKEVILRELAATRGASTSAPSGRGGEGRSEAPSASSLPAASAEASKPPAPASPSGETWSRVVGRKAARRANKPPPTTPSAPSKGRKRDGKVGQSKSAPLPKKKRRARLGRLPASAAVSLTLEAGSEETLASSMALARQSIDLRAMAIAELRPKRALTGGLLLEIPGKEGAAKADKLAAEMAALLVGRGVRVGRPTKFAEVRVCGLADDATPEGVREALAKIGDCPEGDIRVGPIRMDPSGLGTAWARLPLAGARKVTARGAVTVGWTLASVEALRQRPLRCYRCLHVGHVGQRCTSRVVRSNRCYRCSASGHLAGECPAAEPKCPLCSDLGRPAGHRLGSAGCAPRPSGGRGAAVRGQMPPHKKKAVAIPPAAAPRAKRARAGSGRGEVDGRGPASSLPPTA